MYPGVPEVSVLFSGRRCLAMPRSVKWIYPLESRTKFSGLRSRWIILRECRYSRPENMQAAKNLVYSSVNWCFLHIWYLKSPPGIRSINKYRYSRSWNACRMLTINLCFIWVRSSLSFATDSMLFLVIILNYRYLTPLSTFPSWHNRILSFYLPLSTPSQILLSQSHDECWIGFCLASPD